MPVIPAIDQAIQMGLKMMPQAPADVVGSITVASQVAMALCALQPMAPFPIPVIPMGSAVSMIMTKIEAMMFMMFEQIAKIIKSLMEQYTKMLKDALAARKAGEAKLYKDLVAAQTRIKTLIPPLQVDIAAEQQQILDLRAKQVDEQSKYMQTLFTFRDNAHKADLAGDTTTRDVWIAKATTLDPWLAQIIQMSIEIINKTIEVKQKQADLKEYQRLAAISITADWNMDVNLATDFGVPVPYHPDVPSLPSLPVLPPIPKEPDLVKAIRKAMAKWMATPTVPPMGIAIAAILQMIMGLAPNSAATAAQMEAQSDSMLLLLAGCI
jgi:hypothetical protein